MTEHVKVALEEQFDTQEYDVTDCGTQFCLCGNIQLILDQETVKINATTCCNKANTEVAYGEVGNVNQMTSCGCCAALSGDFLPNSGGEGVPALSPGCGCEGEKVSMIVNELRRRVRLRGDVAVRKRAEEQAKNIKILADQVQTMEYKLDAIMTHLKVPPMERS